MVLGPSQLFRMNAPSRSQSALPKVLDQFSRKNAHGTFYIPTKAELMRFRVVVSTCISACVPYNIGVPRGHFTHIFVDEAGQAAEPEAMIPIKTMSDGRTNIILSGDPKQLGPIVRSDLALTLNLGVSYLDRLCEMKIYNESQMSGITYVIILRSLRHNIELHTVLSSYSRTSVLTKISSFTLTRSSTRESSKRAPIRSLHSRAYVGVNYQLEVPQSSFTQCKEKMSGRQAHLHFSTCRRRVRLKTISKC